MKTIFFDCESDNLSPLYTQIWIVCGKVKGSSEIVSAREPQKFTEWFLDEKPDRVVNHGLLSYDLPLLERLWGITSTKGASAGSTGWYRIGKESHILGHKCQLIDTLLLSQFLNPDREGGHSLDNFGALVGCPKMDYRGHLVELGVMTGSEPKGFEFTFWHPSMEVYCGQDILTNELAFDYLLKEVERY